jgi:NAD(P)H-dependent flavin oxidoreductase YrpB (nitropropane dioxygenase family)
MASKVTLRTALCDLLDIEYPIILAGMGVFGMATPPRLVAAVSNAGGLGVLGGSGLDPEDIRQRCREVRELTDRPYGVDLLLPASLAPAAATRSGVKAELESDFPKHVAFVKDLMKQFDLPEIPIDNEIVLSDAFMEAQIQVCLDENVPVFAAGLGDPARIVPRARKQNMTVMGLVGSTRNALRQVASGVDIVVAQGTEGGGHTGRTANYALLPQTVDAIAPVPVVAAGGITDGRGVAASLMFGAVGVWIGTAFLVAEECDYPDALKQRLIDGQTFEFDTSKYWTGKPVRSQRNAISEAWAQSGLPALPTPHQRVLAEDILASARHTGRWDMFFNPGGQGVGALTEIRPAAEILDSMVKGAVEILKSVPDKIDFG